MKPIAIILFIVLSSMVMENTMAKYLLVNLDQTERRSKLSQRCEMSKQNVLRLLDYSKILLQQ